MNLTIPVRKILTYTFLKILFYSSNLTEIIATLSITKIYVAPRLTYKDLVMLNRLIDDE